MVAKKKTAAKKRRRKAVPKYTPEQLSRFQAEHPYRFGSALQSFWGNNPEQAKQALIGRGLAAPEGFSGVPGEMDVAGGQQQDAQALEAMDQAQRAELARQQLAQGLMGQLQDIQRDPYNIVNAMQAYGAGGGGTLGAASALAATGGAGRPSLYGDATGRIMDQLIAFATGQGGSVAGAPEAAGAPGAPGMSMLDAIAANPDALATVQANMRKRAGSKKGKSKGVKKVKRFADSLATMAPYSGGSMGGLGSGGPGKYWSPTGSYAPYERAV